MSLTTTMTDGAQIVKVNAERIDAAMAIQFKEDMRGMTGAGGTRFVLDLAQVDFIDSSGLGAVVASLGALQ